MQPTSAATKAGIVSERRVRVSGWGYLVAWGGLGALAFGDAREAAVVIGAGLGLLIVAEVGRADRHVKQG